MFRLAVLWVACAVACGSAFGATLYVSKLGDGSDGASWSTAYRTIQAALDAVPDAQGGHRIVVRPDTYFEANLAPSQRGAQGAYNELIGDYDGALGSGTRGWVVIDGSDPQKGFKSYDWYGTIRSTKQGWSPEHTEATFSAIVWDRWRLSRIYGTGGDGGLFWDTTDKVEPFTIVVEDCVGVGRAFGGGVGNCLSRADEPIVFRRCTLWSLDWWGDAAGAYIRVENEVMPEQPDAIFEDCTLVGPQCSLKAGNYGFHTYTRVRVENCSLVTLNFSQPQGTPTDGIIQSVEHGRYLHVDLKASTLMGYKVFGVKVAPETANEIQYTAGDAVQAYVQFQQEVPKGMHRMTQWPTDVFSRIAPPSTYALDPILEPDPYALENMCEVSPVVWKGKLTLLECHRPGSGGEPHEFYLLLRDVESGKELARLAEGYGLASAFVHDDTMYVTASLHKDNDWDNVTLFKSTDLEHWEQKVIIEQESEHLFNSSVCKDPDGFVLVYESNDANYPAFTLKFARSDDLDTWTKLPESTFGRDRYTACPIIRYSEGYYYMLYIEARSPQHYFETFAARSKDLRTWERAAGNPVLVPKPLTDGINASDPDLVEFNGKTYVYYSVGDQLTWMSARRTTYNGPLDDFFQHWFKGGGIVDKASGTP